MRLNHLNPVGAVWSLRKRISSACLVATVATSVAVTVSVTGPAVARADVASSAVAWAEAHNGEVYGTPKEQPAQEHQWSGFCWTFVYDAFAGAAPREPTAQDGFNYYNSRGMVQAGSPPAGSIAFYSYGSDGHAAVAVGGGEIIGTHGTSSERLAVFQTAYDRRGLPYLGWVAPSEVGGLTSPAIIATEPQSSGGVDYMLGVYQGNNTFSWSFTNLQHWAVPDQVVSTTG